MNKNELNEAHRIADELMETHLALVNSGQPGLDPHAMDTIRLARAIKLFQAKADPDKSEIGRRQRQHEATL
jgi:hypothetical protein